MIKIDKQYDQRPPKVDILADTPGPIQKLIRQALQEETAHKARTDYYRGDFDDPNSVLHALFKLYHYKCGYCEAELSNCQSALVVEHYRPKKANPAGEKADPDPSIHHQGYYWLTYEWSNLLLSCSTCNGGKGSSFPVRGARQQGPKVPSDFQNPKCLNAFRVDMPAYRNECPLLLNPEWDDPSPHFDFTAQGCLLLKTERAEKTATLCKLNRTLLCLDRKKVLDKLLMELNEAAVWVITTIHFRQVGKDKIYLVLGSAFKPLFNRIHELGEARRQYAAFGSWIRKNLLKIVRERLRPEAFQIIKAAWDQYQR